MTELNLKIDNEKCIHCGLCIKDCIANVLEFDENNIPKITKGGKNRCIKCQHCFAICPTGALSILNKSADNSDSIKEQNPEDILNLIKSRRSIRQYKKENLSPDLMNKLKDMLKWSPTGCNFHKMHFSFVDDISVMDDIRNHVNQKIINFLTKSPVKAVADKFGYFKNAFINGEDVIFRNAPHMLVVSTPTNAPCSNIDPIIALSYFELYAQSLGVGTIWCGFGLTAMRLFPELSKQLYVPDGYKTSYVMLFGPADIKYQRTTQPEPFEITSAEKDYREMSFIEKTKRYFWNWLK